MPTCTSRIDPVSHQIQYKGLLPRSGLGACDRTTTEIGSCLSSGVLTSAKTVVLRILSSFHFIDQNTLSHASFSIVTAVWMQMVVNPYNMSCGVGQPNRLPYREPY